MVSWIYYSKVKSTKKSTLVKYYMVNYHTIAHHCLWDSTDPDFLLVFENCTQVQ